MLQYVRFLIISLCISLILFSFGEYKPKGYGGQIAYRIFAAYYFDGYIDAKMNYTVNWLEGKGEAALEWPENTGYPKIYVKGYEDCVYEISQYQRIKGNLYSDKPSLVIKIDANKFYYDTANVKEFENPSGTAFRVSIKSENNAMSQYGSSIGDLYTSSIQPSKKPEVPPAIDRANKWLADVKNFKTEYCKGLNS